MTLYLRGKPSLAASHSTQTKMLFKRHLMSESTVWRTQDYIGQSFYQNAAPWCNTSHTWVVKYTWGQHRWLLVTITCNKLSHQWSLACSQRADVSSLELDHRLEEGCLHARCSQKRGGGQTDSSGLTPLSLAYCANSCRQTRFHCLLWFRGSDVWKRVERPVLLTWAAHARLTQFTAKWLRLQEAAISGWMSHTHKRETLTVKYFVLFKLSKSE